MTKNQSLAELSNELKEAEAMLEESSFLGLETEDYEKQIDVIWQKLITKTRKLDFFFDKLDVEIDQNASVNKTYTSLSKYYKNRADTLKKKKRDLLQKFLEAGLIKKGSNFKTDFHTYYLKETQKPKLEEGKEEKEVLQQLPKEYQKIEIKTVPDMEKIEEALKAGKIVPGYTLATNQTVIRR